MTIKDEHNVKYTIQEFASTQSRFNAFKISKANGRTGMLMHDSNNNVMAQAESGIQEESSINSSNPTSTSKKSNL